MRCRLGGRVGINRPRRLPVPAHKIGEDARGRLGEGYLDGDEAKEAYKATVDSNGRFIWNQSYGE